MRIAVGADHAGVPLNETAIAELRRLGHEVVDLIQLTAPDRQDVSIPGEPYTFGVSKEAQALGDFESLARRHRRAIRIDLGGDIEQGLRRLLTLVQGLPRKSTTAQKVA